MCTKRQDSSPHAPESSLCVHTNVQHLSTPAKPPVPPWPASRFDVSRGWTECSPAETLHFRQDRAAASRLRKYDLGSRCLPPFFFPMDEQKKKTLTPHHQEKKKKEHQNSLGIGEPFTVCVCCASRLFLVCFIFFFTTVPMLLGWYTSPT